MKVVIKRELKNLLKNPLFYVGIILIFIGIYSNVFPFLQVHYFENDAEIQSIVIENYADADVMDGYIPTTKDQKISMGLEKIKEIFIQDYEMNEREADEAIADIESKGTISEICKHLEEKHDFYGAKISFEECSFIQGNADQVNGYIKSKLDEHDYSWYFARKFSDFTGLYIIFLSMILLASLFIRDMKKDTYELLHTKPITASQFIYGKIISGFLAIIFILTIMIIIFSFLCNIQGGVIGLLISFLNLCKASILYVLPGIFMVICVYAATALIFRNPLPALPALLIYVVYSNMGSTGPNGVYGYYGRAFAIMVRFPGKFFEIAPPPMVLLNQLFLILGAILLSAIATMLWKRRRN